MEGKIKETEEIVEQSEGNVAQEEKSKESKLHKLTSWYGEYRKPIIVVLCALTAICWLTAKAGLTKLVLYVGKLGCPEYTEVYEDYRGQFLYAQTNLVMTEFKTVIFVVGILLLIGILCIKDYYVSSAAPATSLCMINFGLITLGFSMLAYGVLLLCLYKIYSISAIVYILIGVFCFVLLPCASKDFDADHPDRHELKIVSYICGFIGVFLIVAMGFGNVKKDATAIKEEKEQYRERYLSIYNFTGHDWGEDEENYIYVRLHFFNEYNKNGKNYDYFELKESYLNLKEDNGKSWMLLKEFRSDYIDFYYLGEYKSDIYADCDYATGDYMKLVFQQLYYGGYIYGDNGYYQAMLDTEVLDHACQEADKVYTTLRSFEEYNQDIEITIDNPLIVGEAASLDISYPENNGEYHAYMMKLGRVSYVGSEAMIEEKNCLSDEEFIIKDDSVYLLQLMVISDLHHSLGEDVKVSVEGIDYEDVVTDTWTYTYADDAMGEQKEAIAINVWVTTGDCDGSCQTIEELKLDVQQGLSEGDSIEAVSGVDVIKTDNPNVVVTEVSWEAEYPELDLEEETKFTDEPKMYKLYATLFCETGYGFTEDTVGYIGGNSGKKLPKWSNSMKDFWSGGYVNLSGERLYTSVYYYRITADTKYYGINGASGHGGLGINYDYATAGTIVTLDPQPAYGYKFREYRVELEIDDAEKYENWKPVIENNTFVMPAAPIKITAVFEKE